jgi:cytoskeletal protein CcmA (bactofilin family)
MNNPKTPAAGKKTTVEEGTEFRGSLNSSCPIEVKGFVEGELTAPGLTVSSTGAVHGKVKVVEITSEGEIAGEFDADVVRLSGVVKDNTVIRAKSLEVKLAPANGKMQVIFGECELEVGEDRTQRTASTSERPHERTSTPPAYPREGAPYPREGAPRKGSNGSVVPPPLES